VQVSGSKPRFAKHPVDGKRSENGAHYYPGGFQGRQFSGMLC
jgi:hypothetical protein